MTVRFADKKLGKILADYGLCCKKMGSIRAKLLYLRLYALERSKTLEAVRHMSGRFHELSGNRKGQWACSLDHPYRLIFKPADHPIPCNEDGQYIWSKITSIEIIEIVDYH
ncbi:MAG: type II toxin-antitoxin system RelE/ParE family toxin [Bacteroidetes bacterium]|nr:type II toxin-antitoxin system RelE/ParE family toxin [Bacteroidota bacterium]